jgi:hypothetical protein
MSLRFISLLLTTVTVGCATLLIVEMGWRGALLLVVGPCLGLMGAGAMRLSDTVDRRIIGGNTTSPDAAMAAVLGSFVAGLVAAAVGIGAFMALWLQVWHRA